MTIKDIIQSRQTQFLDELFSLMRIPSVSGQQAHLQDMQDCAQRWKEILLSSGVDKAEIFQTKGHPIVYGEKIIDPKAHTVLVYGHYDVMPEDPVELWTTPPFEPRIENGLIKGRGADDDKGQSMIQVKAFQLALENNLLACNVKFLFEGEEEIGSIHLEEFCRDHKDLLKADVILVSDTSMLGADTPSITTGLRGISYWEVEVTGAARDLHSGIFGGAVPNPIQELSAIISRLIDKEGKITIPGFYDKVQEASAEERTMLAAVPHDDEAYRKSVGAPGLKGEKGYSTIERTGIRPTLDVCGIWGGYTGEGVKTVLPSKAYAKISTRLVPNQDYQEIGRLFEDYIRQLAPPEVKVQVRFKHGGNPYVCSLDLPAYKAAEAAYHKVFGKRPLAIRRGGSIPVIATFEKVLGIKSILMGFGLESNAIHSPNENFPLNLWLQSIEVVVEFYRLYK